MLEFLIGFFICGVRFKLQSSECCYIKLLCRRVSPPFSHVDVDAICWKETKTKKETKNKLIPPTGDPSEEADALDWLISRQSKFFLQLYKSQFHPRASPFDEKKTNKQIRQDKICKERKAQMKSVDLCVKSSSSLFASPRFIFRNKLFACRFFPLLSLALVAVIHVAETLPYFCAKNENV